MISRIDSSQFLFKFQIAKSVPTLYDRIKFEIKLGFKKSVIISRDN
jgi:hypothetical protein